MKTEGLHTALVEFDINSSRTQEFLNIDGTKALNEALVKLDEEGQTMIADQLRRLAGSELIKQLDYDMNLIGESLKSWAYVESGKQEAAAEFLRDYSLASEKKSRLEKIESFLE